VTHIAAKLFQFLIVSFFFSFCTHRQTNKHTRRHTDRRC